MSVQLVKFLQSEQIAENSFRGESRDLNTPQVYGGQVLGQAIHAAHMTVKQRVIHSTHAYFLRRGDFNEPIDYEVERSRDGGSFSARRVVAMQKGRPIFTLAASFQKQEEGLDYTEPFDMPPGPEEIEVPQATLDGIRRRSNILFDEAFTIRPVELPPDPKEPTIQFWIKTAEKLADDDALHCAALAYISDFGLLTSVGIPHGYLMREQAKKPETRLMMASIDHVIWFHRPFRMDEWHLFSSSPISTSGSRGLARGRVFNRSGQLIVTTAQEGLVREVDR